MIIIRCKPSKNKQFNLNHSCDCDIKESHYHVNPKYLDGISYFKDMFENTNDKQIEIELPFKSDYIYNFLCWLTEKESILYTLKDIKLGAFLRCDEYLSFILKKFTPDYEDYLEKYNLYYLISDEVYEKCYQDCLTILKEEMPIPKLYEKIPSMIDLIFKDVPITYIQKFYDWLMDELKYNDTAKSSFPKDHTLLFNCLILHLIKILELENVSISKIKPVICFYYAEKTIDEKLKKTYFDLLPGAYPESPIVKIKYEESKRIIYLEKYIITLETDGIFPEEKLTNYQGKTIKSITRGKNVIDDIGKYFILIVYTDYTFDRLTDKMYNSFSVKVEEI